MVSPLDGAPIAIDCARTVDALRTVRATNAKEIGFMGMNDDDDGLELY
jgi:hypothetical protein